MEDLKTRLINLIISLPIEDGKRQKLKDRVEQEGPTAAIAEEVAAIMDESIAQYQASAQNQISNMEQIMAGLVNQLNSDFKEIEKEIKNSRLEERKQQDQEQINNIKKILK